MIDEHNNAENMLRVHTICEEALQHYIEMNSCSFSTSYMTWIRGYNIGRFAGAMGALLTLGMIETELYKDLLSILTEMFQTHA